MRRMISWVTGLSGIRASHNAARPHLVVVLARGAPAAEVRGDAVHVIREAESVADVRALVHRGAAPAVEVGHAAVDDAGAAELAAVGADGARNAPVGEAAERRIGADVLWWAAKRARDGAPAGEW